MPLTEQERGVLTCDDSDIEADDDVLRERLARARLAAKMYREAAEILYPSASVFRKPEADALLADADAMMRSGQ